MYAPEKIKKEEHLTDKRILSILRRAPKRGIWMKDLAKKLDISRPLLNYYLFGMKKNKNWSGGRIRSEISVRNQGNNRFICLEQKTKLPPKT